MIDLRTNQSRRRSCQARRESIVWSFVQNTELEAVCDEHGTLNGYDNMDPLMVEVNRLCYIQNLLRNISDEDMLRAVSTLKALAKGNQVSDRIMERLNKTLTF